MRINALGTVNVAEAALAVAKDGSAVVNVASIAGHLSPTFLQAKRAFELSLTDSAALIRTLSAKARNGQKGYSVSKSFVIWYSQKMAAAFGAKGARILSVSPGIFDTRMDRLEEKKGSGQMVEFAALKRFGTPEEMAELLAFCASTKARYPTGTDILNDGGNRAGLGFKALLSRAKSAR